MNNIGSLPTLSLIIPCFNELKAIDPVIRKAKALKNSPDFERHFSNLEVIVADDQSNDGSYEKLTSIEGIHVVQNEIRLGYGGALKNGFLKAKGDYIFFLDMDDSYQPEDVLKLWNCMKATQADVVFGNRVHDKQGMPWVRRVGNLFFTQVVKSFHRSRLQDVTTGFRLFHNSSRPHFLKPKENDLNYSMALTVELVRSSLKIEQVPIQYHERIGKSKLNPIVDGLRFLKSAGRL